MVLDMIDGCIGENITHCSKFKVNDENIRTMCDIYSKKIIRTRDDEGKIFSDEFDSRLPTGCPIPNLDFNSQNIYINFIRADF